MKIKEKTALLNLRVTSVLAIFGNLFINLSQGLGERDFERYVHVGFAFLIFLLTFSGKFHLTQRRITFLFVSVYVPFYLHAWNYHQDHVLSGITWSPFFPLQVHALVLSFLYSGQLLINAFLIAGFIAEEIFIWNFFDLTSSPHTLLFEEPARSILFYSVALVLLVYRSKNDEYLQKLAMERVRSEELKNRVRLVTGIRERATPSLQTLKTGLEIFRVKFPKEVNLIQLLEDSVKRLTSLNSHLRREDMALSKEE